MYRKRYIPNEVVDISGDEILYRDDKMIITKWAPIHPREDISGGISFTFLDKGYKISRFNKADGEFSYWYCDIIAVEHDKTSNAYTFIDLLVDVKIFPDGQVRVLDMNEIADALEEKLITQEQACDALRKLSDLLEMIYTGKFPPPDVSDYLNR